MAKEETEGKRRIKTDKKVYRSNKKLRKERKDKNEKTICFQVEIRMTKEENKEPQKDKN